MLYPRAPDTYTKACTICGVVKPATQFYSQPRCKDGLQSRCNSCQVKAANAWRKKDPKRHAKYNSEWAQKNKRSVRNTRLKRLYGITMDVYDAMLAQQDGKCAICGTTEPGGNSPLFHVDHCHDSSVIRGLLCGKCNFGIGQLDHDVSRLQAAIDYLNRSSSRTPR